VIQRHADEPPDQTRPGTPGTSAITLTGSCEAASTAGRSPVAAGATASSRGRSLLCPRRGLWCKLRANRRRLSLLDGTGARGPDDGDVVDGLREGGCDVGVPGTVGMEAVGSTDEVIEPD
jgi:hypothetical protein